MTTFSSDPLRSSFDSESEIHGGEREQALVALGVDVELYLEAGGILRISPRSDGGNLR
ncbi:hypothetical protein GCM10011579_032550 [Streptomyces albiflavescens]|uniref:Uncharacterized protein n=1 Tax=Streptomyces albiflavescens TaxID=1623582 RepID=A0A917Y2R9_9ACTN|nr:hypothetical protein GCM10011579_032550 [Streptomyces albiflavescens]